MTEKWERSINAITTMIIYGASFGYIPHGSRKPAASALHGYCVVGLQAAMCTETFKQHLGTRIQEGG